MRRHRSLWNRAHQGRGVGREPGQHVLDGARAAELKAIQVNAVVETNMTAVNLWSPLGYEVGGDKRDREERRI